MHAALTASACSRSATSARRPARLSIRRRLVLALATALLLVSVMPAMARAAAAAIGSGISLPLAGGLAHKPLHRRVTRKRHRLQHGRRLPARADDRLGTARSTKLVVGVQGTVGANSYQPNTASDILDAGVRWDRGAEDMRAARALGFSNLAVPQDGPDGNCTGDSVSQVVALARAQVPAMEANGQHLMELCNEAYITVSAQTYGRWYDAVHKMLAGTGITLGANAIWPSACGKAYSSGGCDWVGQVIAEIARLNGVPKADAAKEIDAWTIHPYAWPVSTYAYYIKTAHDRAVADGSNAPWWVTETGACLNTCWMSSGTRTSQDQADELTAELDDLVQRTGDAGTPFSWVKVWIWYDVVDQSDGQWGLFDHTCPAKCTITGLRPSYYALKSWMQTHAGRTDR